MKKRFASIVVAITVLSLLLVTLVAKLGVQTAPTDDWPMFRHDPAHSGESSSTPVINPTLLWNFTIGSAIDSSPAVKDGIIYICSPTGEIFALNATNGNQIWNLTTGHTIYRSSPCVANGVAYIGSFGVQGVYALNAAKGDQLWLFNTWFDKGRNRGIMSSPTIAQDILYFTSDGGSLYAVNAKSGEQVWAVHFANNGVSSSPAVVNGVVYVGAAAHDPFHVVETNGVYAFKASNGSPIWNYTGIGSVISSPSISKGVVYVGSFDSNVYALNASNGDKIWNFTTSVPLTNESGIIIQRNTGGPVESSPAVADGIVYVGSYDHNVYALNATNGNKLWNYATGNIVRSSPAVAGDVVYLGSEDNNIYALNATNGSLIWNYATLGGVTSSPAVANEVVYVGSSDGKIYALSNP